MDIRVTFSNINEMTNTLPLEKEYFSQTLSVESDYAISHLEFDFLPQGLSYDEQSKKLCGVIEDLSKWTNIDYYESKKTIQKGDNEVCGVLNVKNHTPLTYGYLRKMNKENPSWIHYSGINYSMFGKAPYALENKHFISSIAFYVHFQDSTIQPYHYDTEFLINIQIDSMDFIDRYKASNG